MTFVQNVVTAGNAIQRHRSEQRRRESERRFREIAGCVPTDVSAGRRRRVHVRRPGHRTLLGYSPEELVDRLPSGLQS
ncbi:hypothetical protein C9J85_11285 [Haloferax sp. wsp5]|nr:hypothetical protein C9J85_11285 [Haloferax sp. wsp5]